MKKPWKKLLVARMWLVTRLSTTQMNLKKEDMKYKTVKIFSLVENLLRTISSLFNN